MTKYLLKLSTALFMLSSDSSAFAASQCDETRIKAATKIQRFYQDNKLRLLFDSIDLKNDFITFSEEKVRALNECSDFKSIITAAMFFFIKGSNSVAVLDFLDLDHVEPETVASYRAYIDTQITNTDSIRRQIAVMIKAQFVPDGSSKLNMLHTLLQEMLHSPYPFFRWKSYEELSRAHKNSGDMAQALSYLLQAFDLPTTYHAYVYEELADFDDSEEYTAKRHFCLQRITKIGTSEQKTEALFDIADLYMDENSAFYRPIDALNIYETLLGDTTLNTKEKYRAHVELANFLSHGPVGIKDNARSIALCEEVIAHKEVCEELSYALAASLLINHYMRSNPIRALHLAREALANQKLSNILRKQIKTALVNLYHRGSTDFQSHHEAFKILGDLIGNPINEKTRLTHLFQLAVLLMYGNDEIKNEKEAIVIFEKLRNEVFQNENYWIKEYSLLDLFRLYSSNPVYKNLAKEAGYLQELVILYVGKPLEQIKCLIRLLTIYTTEGETLSSEGARMTSERILNHQAVDPTARLAVQTALSKFYHNHPEYSTHAEIIQLNEELAHNPMASVLETGNAYNRLIAIYVAQQNLDQVIATYEHWLTRAANWQQQTVAQNFIAFLENEEHAAVRNPARVAELQAIMLRPLPQNTDFMTTDHEHYVPGVVAGFGKKGGYVDPFFSPEIVANRQASLRTLRGDPFNELTYAVDITRTIAEIKLTIAEYGARDPDFHATAEIAVEVFETGNTHQASYRPTIQDMDYRFSIDSENSMEYGQALVRIWARITSHAQSTELKDLFVVQLAEARDPDGHIVCHPGKFSRHCQVLEGYFSDIHAVTLSLRDIFSHFAQQEQMTFDELPRDNSLKVLKTKIHKPNGDEEAAGEVIASALQTSTWVSPQYHAKFTALSSEEQETLNTYFEQMVTRFEQNLLCSRDTLSEAERTFSRTETAGYLSVTLFM